jgi:hypothetical protein
MRVFEEERVFLKLEIKTLPHELLSYGSSCDFATVVIFRRRVDALLRIK